MQFDYSKLKGRIAEKFGTQDAFASKMNMTSGTLSLKINNKATFRQNEIILACCLLKIPVEEIPYYFFSQPDQDFIG